MCNALNDLLEKDAKSALDGRVQEEKMSSGNNGGTSEVKLAAKHEMRSENQGAEQIARTLKAHHRELGALCRSLEAMADSLQVDFDVQNCLTVCRKVFPTIRRAHLFEEEILFPYLQRNFPSAVSLSASLERLRFEHWEDESYAEELTESLHSFATGHTVNHLKDGAEKLGYMLRGFFEGLRRHMAFESEHLLPMLHVDQGERA